MSQGPDPILWRRLDLPGHDTAAIRLTEEGAVLTGMAVFLEGAPTALAYTLRCDSAWRTVEATVRGWRGPAPVDLRFRRAADGRWTLNDAPCPAVAGCLDLDLGFTPATNLLPLRRLDLAVGQSAEVRSAWLEWPDLRLRPLTQRYARQAPGEYEYEAEVPGPTPFRGALRVEPGGWVLDYAGLWRAEPGDRRGARWLAPGRSRCGFTAEPSPCAWCFRVPMLPARGCTRTTPSKGDTCRSPSSSSTRVS